MLKIAVCDDNRELLEKVEKDLLEYESTRNMPIMVHTYISAVDLLEEVKKTNYDVLLLDIIMPNFTGMQAAHEIRQFNEEIKIIFLTCYEVTSCQAVFMRSPQPSPFFSFNAGYRGRASDLTVPGLGHSVIRGLVTNRSMVRREFCRLLA